MSTNLCNGLLFKTILVTFVVFNSIQYSTSQIQQSQDSFNKSTDLLVYTVATEENDGFKRFMNSATKFNYNVKVLGLGEKWNGGDVARGVGGGQKVRLLREALEQHKYSGNLVIMFLDSYDLVLTLDSAKLLERFDKFQVNVLFSAEEFCWPSVELAASYPEVGPNEKRFLNSGGFIGHAPQLYTIVNRFPLRDDDDDQLFYTNVFLADREKLNIALDTHSLIFQNLNGALDDVSVNFETDSTYLYNHLTNTVPAVVHGNGPIKAAFNSLTSYITNQWTINKGCVHCNIDTRSLKNVNPSEYPKIFVGIYIEKVMPFVEDFLERFHNLTYPKDKIDVYIHYFDQFHVKVVEKFISDHGDEYKSVEVQSSEMPEYEARKYGFEQCMKMNCEYFFSLDAEAHIEKLDLIEMLIERNRSLVSPMLGRPFKMWTNFWGAVNSDGYYKRSDDYASLVLRERKGLWNVPYVTNVYLLQARHLPSVVNFEWPEGVDLDVAICEEFRNKYIFMYVDNFDHYGHLVNNDDFETDHLNNDLYAIFSNPYTWEKKYIDPEYYIFLHNKTFKEFLTPCPDVFWFPIVTHRFCDDLISEMENFGQWSGGKNEDHRLQGGYENVPTVDIHTNQINWERHWLHFLKTYVAPLNQRAFEGYYTESRAIMNFVVRYRPDEQDRLRPHSDSSTFTVNIALNTPGVDYQGGGVRMVRYDCAVTQLKKGWMLMFPGRLTHQHEGLQVTGGTRYIMVSFVDP
ncbi:hypothetical protein HELRODRAFT_185714 [Helobdella robusta]|uniref:Fe2OG dioxygenase domain-containing protein n=1 Tax=Helobdella robusta TaxID=6412 RepID=T1FN67_HELRO|nr:hypothetical protein HELRODRAFT_185714 [Helobdella robusta]ESO01390.1 hypothetical protein HELRODRAFT_185714 [Helobdella robusta]